MYKLFEAESVKELMSKVTQELGPNAAILNPREVSNGGLTGILGKKKWQVYAYTAPDNSAAMQAPQTPAAAQLVRGSPVLPTPRRPAGQPARPQSPRSRVQQPVNHLIDEPALPFADTRIAEPPPPTAERRRTSPPTERRTPAHTPLAGIEDPIVRTILKEMREIRALSEQMNASVSMAHAASEHVILPGALQPFYQRLNMQEVPRELCMELMDILCQRPSLDINDSNKVAEHLEEILTPRVQTSALDQLFSSRRPRIAFFVGPAGAGKTTTLAKVAALACRDEKMKIAFVTLDTMRVAAAEQLKTYADLISASIEIVMDERELASAVVRHADKDMILVDTPGKDPCSTAVLAEFSGYLKQLGGVRLPPPAVLLVLSAPTRLADIDRYAMSYQALNPAGMVFTKLDETKTYGSLLSIMLSSKLPAVFLTTGQEVPDHIEPASPRRLARRIIGLAP